MDVWSAQQDLAEKPQRRLRTDFNLSSPVGTVATLFLSLTMENSVSLDLDLSWMSFIKRKQKSFQPSVEVGSYAG